MVWGINPVIEALRARPEEATRLIHAEGSLKGRNGAEIEAMATKAGLRFEVMARDKLSALADGGVHQGVMLELKEFSYVGLDEIVSIAKKSGRPGLIVVLDGLQDPMNVGAIIRSAHAFGAHGVVLGKDRSVPITGAVAKASAGALEHTAVARVTNISRALEELKEEGYWSAAADPEGDQTLYEARLDGPIALVVGAEGPGVRDGVLKHCDYKVKIPMLGQVASLNASVSAGVLLSEIVRQQRLTPAPRRL